MSIVNNYVQVIHQHFVKYCSSFIHFEYKINILYNSISLYLKFKCMELKTVIWTITKTYVQQG